MRAFHHLYLPFTLCFLASFWARELEASFTTRITIRPLSSSGAPAASTSDTFTIGSSDAPYNFAEMFAIGSHDYLLLLNTTNGAALTIELDSTGHSMGVVGGANFGTEGFRSAAVVRKDDLSRLFLLAPRDGHVRRYEIRTDGTIDVGTGTNFFYDNLIDKNLFSAFPWSGDQHVFALSRTNARKVTSAKLRRRRCPTNGSSPRSATTTNSCG